MFSPKQVGRTALSLDLPTGGEIVLANILETHRAIQHQQTTPGQTITLPPPDDTTIILSVDVINVGTAPFTIHGVVVPVLGATRLTWSGIAYSPAVAVEAQAPIGHELFPVDSVPSAGTGRVTHEEDAWGSGQLTRLYDTDAAVMTELDGTLTTTFAAADTMQFRLDLKADTANANHVVRIAYTDDGGNAAEELIEIGTAGQAVVAGGADAGNVTGTATTSIFNRGDVDLVRVDFVIAWTGASGANPKLRIAPAYNFDGTAISDVTAVGTLDIDLIRFGDPLEFVAQADVLATVMDASAAAVAETLPGATGTGAVRFFVTSDITNTATIAPQAGESLNGVVDAVFNASNYTAGTQFQAVDTGAGQWEIAVVGQSGLTERTVTALDHTTEVTLLSGAIDLTFDDPVGTAGDFSVFGLSYFDEGSFRYLDLEFTLFDDSSFTIDLGSAIPAGATIEEVVVTHDGNENVANVMAFNPLGGSQFFLNKDNSYDGLTGRARITLGGVAEGTVVLAGMVQPTAINALQIRNSTSQSIAPTIPADIIFDTLEYQQGSELTFGGANNGIGGLKVGKRYRIRFEMELGTLGANRAPIFVLKATDGIGGETNLRTMGFSSGSGDAVTGHRQEVEFMYFVPIDNTEVWVDVTSAGGANTVTTSANECVLSVQELPESTVVMPDALVPIDAEELLFTTDTAATGNNFDITGAYADLTALQTEFESLRVVIGAHHNTAGLEEDWFTNTIPLDSVKVDDRFVLNDTVNVVAADLISATNMEVSFGGVYVNALNRVRVYGVRGQKTIVAYNPDQVEAKTLHYFSANSSSAYGSVADLDFSDTQFSVANYYDPQSLVSATQATIKQTGIYRVNYSGYASGSSSSIQIAVNGTLVNAEGASIGNHMWLSEIINLSAGDVVTFPIATGTVDSPRVSIQQLPTEEVVTPGDVPVEDMEVVLFNATIADAGTAVLDGGVTWADVVATYERVRFSYTNNASGSIYGTNEVHTSQLTGTSDLIFLPVGSASSITFDQIDAVDGGFRMDNTFSDPIDVEIVGVKAQKTVINETTTPTDDQAASGYFDIGNMRMQWGKVTTGGNNEVQTLPAPFADTDYVVSITGEDSAVSVTGASGGRTTTQFDIRQWQTTTNADFAGVITWHWQAIGLKP